MEFENQAANAVADNGEGIADPIEESTQAEAMESGNVDTDSAEIQDTEEGINPNNTPDNTANEVNNDVTQTQAFARRLKEETERIHKETQDRTVAQMRIPDPLGGYVTTYDRYMELVHENELREQAERQGLPIELLKQQQQTEERMRQLEEHIQNTERQNLYYADDERLKSDPDIKDFYIENENDIKTMYQNYGGKYSLDTITMHFLRKNYNRNINTTAKKAEQQTIKSLNDNVQGSPGSLTDKTDNTTIDYLKMSKKDFQRELDKVLNG